MKFLTIAILITLVAAGYSLKCWAGGSLVSNKPISTGDLREYNCPSASYYCTKILRDNTVNYGCGACDKNGKKDLPGAVMYCCDTDQCNSIGAKGISAILIVVALATSLIL